MMRLISHIRQAERYIAALLAVSILFAVVSCSGNKETEQGSKPYGYFILMEGKGVCEDYAEAVSLLMNLAGLDCYTAVTDEQVDNIYDRHAWNIVRIDGVYYEIDCTWDDDSDPECWRYFNLSRVCMSADVVHNIDLSKYARPLAERSMNKLEYLMAM